MSIQAVSHPQTGLAVLELQQPKAFPLHTNPAESNLNFSRLQVHAFLDSLSWIFSL